MTEEEAQTMLINLTREYMKHSSDERKVLYNEYKENRNKIQEALINSITEKRLLQLEENKIIR